MDSFLKEDFVSEADIFITNSKDLSTLICWPRILSYGSEKILSTYKQTIMFFYCCNIWIV